MSSRALLTCEGQVNPEKLKRSFDCRCELRRDMPHDVSARFLGQLCFHIIRNLETMHDCDLHTFYMRALRIIWKRTRGGARRQRFDAGYHRQEERLGSLEPQPLSSIVVLLLFVYTIGHLETMHD